MKVGFLHGCCQDNAIFTSLMKPYCEIMKKTYGVTECIFIEAQYEHSRKGKTWFQRELELTKIGTDDISNEDIELTLSYVEDIIRKQNIEILIGFSQGGNVMDTYLRTRNTDDHIKRAMILNAYSFPRYVHLKPSLEKLVFITSLQDDIVPHDILTENYDSTKKLVVS